MVLPILAGVALGGLLGGSTSQQTTVTTTNSLNNAFNPVNNVNLGGGISSNPFGDAFGNPSTSASASTQIAPPDPNAIGSILGIPQFGASGAPVSLPTLAQTPVAGNILTDNLPLLLIGGAALLFLNKKGK